MGHYKKKTKKKLVKRDAKASVFTHLFTIPKYMKELYLSLHPKEEDIDESELKNWTISSIFTNIQINDLGILVRDKLIILVEAQSIWTLNILPRTLEYLSEIYNRYIQKTNQNIYGTKKVRLPRPELYVVYTGKNKINKNIISLRKDFFNDETYPIDVEIKVITLKNATNVIKDYIKFTKILDKNNKKLGYTKESIIETIESCVKRKILKDYLNEYKMEVYNIMTSIYDQEYATEMYGREQYAEGKEEGIKEGERKGIEKGKISILTDMVKDKVLSIKEAAKMIGMTQKEFLKIAKI